MGRQTVVESDHSPLEQIFKKNIADAPARLQRILLRSCGSKYRSSTYQGPRYRLRTHYLESASKLVQDHHNSSKKSALLRE